MSTLHVDGADLFYEETGVGDPLVLVHGSWGDHFNWIFAAPDLAKSFRVISYDRRGHSQSTGGGKQSDDVDDLAAVIEQIGGGRAHVVGNSFGAAISLKLACARPELFVTLAVHEPPLFGVIADDPELKELYDENIRNISAVVKLLEDGEMEEGARTFVETVALGPGGWAMLPPPVQQVFASNAATFLEEMQDGDWSRIDTGPLNDFPAPLLISRGDESPPLLQAVVEKLWELIPKARRHVYQGAGHVPHSTHPGDLVAKTTAFALGGA